MLRLVLCGAWVGLAASGKPAPKAPGAPPPAPVEVATVERRAVPLELSAIGTAESVASVRIRPKVGGEILEVLFQDGADVRAGQELFRLDPRPYDAALKRAEANLAIARAQAANADDQARRYTELKTKGAASGEQFDQIISAAESQQAQRAAREADVEETRLAREWSTVVSPIDGRAGAALVKRGNIVQANGDVLVVINQMRPIEVAFALPEGTLPDLRKRTSEGPLSVEVSDPVADRPIATGNVVFVDNAIDRQSGRVLLKARFENADGSLWPGQFLDVLLRLSEGEGELTVPATAVIEGQAGPKVFVVRDGVAQMRPIKVERVRGDSAVIAEGLEAGDQVVTSGQLRVTPGGRVMVKQ